MESTVITIKKSEVIAPKSAYTLNIQNGCFVLIEATGHLHLGTSNPIILEPGDIVIGGNIFLENQSKDFVQIRGFTFKMPLDQQLIMSFKVYKRFHLDVSITTMLNTFESNSYQRLIKAILNSFQSIEKLIISNSASENLTNSKKGKIDKRLITINRYIRMHYNTPLTLKILADLIQCSPVYLSNTYTRVFNISPMKYLQNYRMKKAAYLLISSNYPIKEIANRLGYISSSQFSETFKKYYLLSPRQYRINYYLTK